MPLNFFGFAAMIFPLSSFNLSTCAVIFHHFTEIDTIESMENNQRQEAVRFLGMSEQDLVELVVSASRQRLLRLVRLGLVCRCDWFPKLGFGVASDGVHPFAACTHSAETTFSVRVQGLILAKLYPRLYRQPPLDDPSATAITYTQRLALMMDRRRRGKSLFHDLDAQQPGVDGTPSGFVLFGRNKMEKQRLRGDCRRTNKNEELFAEIAFNSEDFGAGDRERDPRRMKFTVDDAD